MFSFSHNEQFKKKLLFDLLNVSVRIFQPKINNNQYLERISTTETKAVNTLFIQNQFPSSPHRARVAAVSQLKLAVSQPLLPPPAVQHSLL